MTFSNYNSNLWHNFRALGCVFLFNFLNEILLMSWEWEQNMTLNLLVQSPLISYF